MRSSILLLYTLTLSLWVGGITIFTFIVTPAIFRSYNRDMAGEIVGRLFPGYFTYTLALSALALLLFFLLGADRSTKAFQLSLALLTLALLANAYVSFKLHPDTVRIKQQVTSFEREPSDSPARREFRRLHAISAVVNLFVLADGVTLLVLSKRLIN
ncbi:MAG: DUF4149 domain-containing protein [Nitrospirota bacterium]|nr:DUF4149 domain-containing protein [Nitrospirota bacterium]